VPMTQPQNTQRERHNGRSAGFQPAGRADQNDALPTGVCDTAGWKPALTGGSATAQSKVFRSPRSLGEIWVQSNK
jgi:hypothetical protein